MDATIEPEPDEHERAAILEALEGHERPPGRDGWAAAALAEGVSADGAEPFQQHDVCSLW